MFENENETADETQEQNFKTTEDVDKWAESSGLDYEEAYENLTVEQLNSKGSEELGYRLAQKFVEENDGEISRIMLGDKPDPRERDTRIYFTLTEVDGQYVYQIDTIVDGYAFKISDDELAKDVLVEDLIDYAKDWSAESVDFETEGDLAARAMEEVQAWERLETELTEI